MKSFVALLGSFAMAGSICAFGQGRAVTNPVQTFSPETHSMLITQYVDDSKLVPLQGDRHPAATAQNDRGPVPDNFELPHTFLQLKRSPAQQQALDQFVASLHDPNSPNYHKWVTADEYGKRFSISQSDIDTVSNWLRNHGFTVNHVYPNLVIDFHGTAGQFRNAFHSEIHNLEVNGERHWASMSAPKIPAALAPAIVGVAGLNDFKPKPMNRPKSQDTVGDGYYLVTPSDLYKIYNFGSSYHGTGQTIAIISQSDAYNSTGSSSDWNVFRNTLGIPTTTYTHASLTTIHPAAGSGGTCTDPGVNGAEGEAAIDIEWSAAAAPDAAIVLVACDDIYIALDNLLTNGGTLPNVISMSYGEEESELGSYNALFSSAYEMATAEGITMFVSSGDSGGDVADQNNGIDTSGINQSGLATTQYNVAVGGTDFEDTYLGANSTYWNSTNNSSYGSAKSYIPEIPWNDSCGSQLLAGYEGYGQTYGSTGFCNSSAGGNFVDNAGGSGGPSSCSSGSGSGCAGWAKPTWQSLVGVPADGVRDVPDVALFAANGLWGHYYVVCWSDTANGGASCSGTPDTWAGFGGTSVASPIFAGIQALINQATSKQWGNANTKYYAFAKTEYGTTGSSSCNSSLGNGVSASCVFYDLTQGDNDMPCTGTNNCYRPSGTYGVLSTSNSAYQPAYTTNTGWDFTSGIGTPNVTNLIAAFIGSSGSPATMTSPTPGSTLSGSSVTFDWTTGTGVTQYVIYVGTTAGAKDIGSMNTGTTTTATFTNIPTNGKTVYVTLYSLISGKYQSNAYTYTAASLANITSPTPGSTLTSTTVTFSWTAASGATEYVLYVGTTPGSKNVAGINTGTNTSATVSNIPATGATLYVTLYYKIGSGSLQSNAYTYTELTSPQITSPTPGSKLSGSTVTFDWTSVSGVSEYVLYVGTTAGAKNIAGINTGTKTSATVSGIPTTGATLYVTLYYKIGSGSLQSNAYTYTEATSANPLAGADH